MSYLLERHIESEMRVAQGSPFLSQIISSHVLLTDGEKWRKALPFKNGGYQNAARFAFRTDSFGNPACAIAIAQYVFLVELRTHCTSHFPWSTFCRVEQ